MRHRIVKVISWRMISISITMFAIWAFTGNIKEATGLTLFLHGLLTIANYLFESLWEKFYESR